MVFFYQKGGQWVLGPMNIQLIRRCQVKTTLSRPTILRTFRPFASHVMFSWLAPAAIHVEVQLCVCLDGHVNTSASLVLNHRFGDQGDAPFLGEALMHLASLPVCGNQNHLHT